MVSDETRAKMAEARRKWWSSLSDEEHKAYGDKQRGQKRPQTSAKMRGRKLSEEHKAKLRTGVIVPCAWCGKEIYRTSYDFQHQKNQYCSRSCSAHAQKNRPRKLAEYVCQNCGKVFERNPGREKFAQIKYCSRTCANEGRRGKGHGNWEGGRQKRGDGYIDIAASIVSDGFKNMVRTDGRVLEHRLVMAQHLGHCLQDFEVVHHKNGIRNDNRIENLELYPLYEHTGVTNGDRMIKRLKMENKRLRKIIKQSSGVITL